MPTKDEDSLLGHKIGDAAERRQRPGLAGAVQRHTSLNLDAEQPGQSHEVRDGAEMDVGALVPCLRQQMRDRHATTEKQI